MPCFGPDGKRKGPNLQTTGKTATHGIGTRKRRAHNRMRSLHLLVAVLLAAPLAAQDLPAPGDYRQAVDRAAGYYFRAMDTVSEAIEAVRADNLTSLRLSAYSYSRVMPILTVWHGRACWKADYEGANVAYPAAGPTMAEVLATWEHARTTGANMEALRASLVESLQVQRQRLDVTRLEMLSECTP